MSMRYLRVMGRLGAVGVIVMWGAAAEAVCAQQAPPAPPAPSPGWSPAAREALDQMAWPPRLGMRVRDVTEEEARLAGLDGLGGALVTAVTADGPAARAGLIVGDLIVRVDDERVRSARHVTRLITETPPGRPLAVEARRNGEVRELVVTPEARTLADSLRSWVPERFEMPEGFEMERLGRAGRGLLPGAGPLGLGVQTLTPQLAAHLGVTAGVLITEVDEDSVAARAGLKAGDVVTRVDGQAVARASDLRRASGRAARGATLRLDVVRERQPVTIEVTLHG
jgi:serine protease Do